MKRHLVFGVLLALVGSVVVFGHTAAAVSLKISPLRYDTTLGPGEKKKGFVDITNPTGDTVHLKLSVQAFRQSGNSGGLEFYDNDSLSAGVILDYTEATLGARETLHLAFVLDATKLPSGDNFAAIFAASIPAEKGPAEQSVRVGTLLMITNGTQSAHTAVVQDLSGQLLQIGDGLHISFVVRNTGDSMLSTGFAPTISVKAWPYVDDAVTGPLVFAGHSRDVEYVKNGNYLGLLAIKVKTGDSEQVIYRFAVTGHWRFFLPFGIVVIGLLVWLILIIKKRVKNRGN